MHCRLGSTTVAAGFPQEKQLKFPMGEIPLGQYSCKKKRKKVLGLSLYTAHLEITPTGSRYTNPLVFYLSLWTWSLHWCCSTEWFLWQADIELQCHSAQDPFWPTMYLNESTCRGKTRTAQSTYVSNRQKTTSSFIRRPYMTSVKVFNTAMNRCSSAGFVDISV